MFLIYLALTTVTIIVGKARIARAHSSPLRKLGKNPSIPTERTLLDEGINGFLDISAFGAKIGGHNNCSEKDIALLV